MTSLSADRPSFVRAAAHPCRLRPIASTGTPSVTPRVWFAILTYNALAYTKRCLASLDLHTTVPWHAVILDNTSTDGTRDWLVSLDDPRITVALSATNRGVAGGRNDLLDLMLPRVPDDGFVVFVDNDLEFHPNWIDPFMALFDRHPTAGMASVSGHEIVVHGERRELLSLPGHTTMPVDVASGGFACFVRPAVFSAIGRYDEELNPFWHEDDDISVRALAAGWDVYAVPTAGVVHHGHKSGVALPSLMQGGSLDKQRYLIEKWRRMGVVSADGRLAFDRVHVDHAVTERLGRRLGRNGAMRRSEFEHAGMDVALLLRSNTREPASSGAMRPLVNARYASAPAKALLEDRTAEGTAIAPERALLGAIQELLQSRRRSTRLSAPALASTEASRPTQSAASAVTLADAGAFDDPTWFADAIQFAGDGRGAQQWYDRSITSWRSTQAAHELRNRGLLSPDSRLLFVTDLRAPLVWGVADAVGELIVADVLERYPMANDGVWLSTPERLATRRVANGRVRCLGIEHLDSALPAAHYHAAVLLPWNAAVSLADMSALLSAIGTRVVPGGLVLTCVPIRLAGPPQPGVIDGSQSIGRWLSPLGLELAGDIHVSMSDAGLLAATDADANGRRTPDLLVADGPRLTGYAFLTARTARRGASHA